MFLLLLLMSPLKAQSPFGGLWISRASFGFYEWVSFPQNGPCVLILQHLCYKDLQTLVGLIMYHYL